MIRLPPRSTPLYSSAASDVYKRQDQLLGEQRAERRVAAQLYLRAILPRYGTRSETGCPSRVSIQGSAMAEGTGGARDNASGVDARSHHRPKEQPSDIPYLEQLAIIEMDGDWGI